MRKLMKTLNRVRKTDFAGAQLPKKRPFTSDISSDYTEKTMTQDMEIQTDSDNQSKNVMVMEDSVGTLVTKQKNAQKTLFQVGKTEHEEEEEMSLEVTESEPLRCERQYDKQTQTTTQYQDEELKKYDQSKKELAKLHQQLDMMKTALEE